MKIVQIVKKLNNTELGKGGMNDTYMLIPNDLSITDIFGELNVSIEFTDKYTGEKVGIRSTKGREKRIVGLGQYYRNKNLCAGDEIMLEKCSAGGKEDYYINAMKHTDNLVVQKSRYGFEILTPDRLDYFQDEISRAGIHAMIQYVKSEKKRSDSPEETDYYDLKVNGKSLMDAYRGKEVIEIRVKGNELMLAGFYGWKKYVYTTEEN